MRVLIVGGGVCGAAVRHYIRRSSGVEVVVWDKGGSVGGRMTTSSARASSGSPVDMGAQYFSAQPDVADTDLHKELHDKGLLVPIPASSIIDSPDPAHDSIAHSVAPLGTASLVNHLMAEDADGCVVHTRRAATALDVLADGRVRATDANSVSEEFDAVVLTAPVPQSVALLETSPALAAAIDPLRTDLDAVTYSSRFAAAVHYPWSDAAKAVQAAIGGIGAYVKSSDGSLRYVAVENAKRAAGGSPGDDEAADKDARSTLSLLLHSSVPFGLAHASLPRDDRPTTLLPLMKAALGAAFDPDGRLGSPVEERIMFWKFSQVYRSPFKTGVVPVPGTPSVLLSGDAMAGRSGFDATVWAGRQTAEHLLSTSSSSFSKK